MTEESGGADPYVQAQIESRQRPAVAKIALLGFRSQYPSGLLLAVEGDDDKVVYSHWLARIRSDLSYEFFVCGGKRGVRQLRNSLYFDLGTAEEDLLYFVDRDFDDLEGFQTTKRVFVLEKYSIENYLVDPGVLDQSIKCAYPGTSDPGSRAQVCRIFRGDYAAFLTVASGVNQRIYIARRLRYDIDDVMPQSIATMANVQVGHVTSTTTLAGDLLPFPEEPTTEELRRLEAEFSKLEATDRHRGKFAMKFLRTWLDRLAEEYRNPKLGIFSVPAKDAGKIKHDELSLGSLASRSPVPSGLGAFLKAWGY